MSRLRSSRSIVSVDMVFTFTASLLRILSTFFVFRILILHEGHEILGIWSLTMGMVALAGLLNLSGAAGLPRFLPALAEDPGRQADFIDTVSICVLVLFTAVAAIGYYPLDWYIQTLVENEDVNVPSLFVGFMALSFVLSMLANSQSRALEGLFLARWRAIAEIIGIVFFCVGSVYLVKHSGIQGVALARAVQFAVAVAICRAVLLAKVRGLRWFPARFSRSSLRQAMSLGFRIQGASVAEATFLASSRVLIEYFWGLSVLGIFEIASRLMQSVYTLFQQTMLPIVAHFATDHTAHTSTEELLQTVSHKVAILGMFAYLAALAGTPVASFILVDEIDPFLIRAAAVLSIGWYIALLALPSVYYARGRGRLRTTILGYWAICALSAILIAGAGATGVAQPSVPVSAAMIVGYSFMFIGIAKETDLISRRLYEWPLLAVSLGSVGAGAMLMTMLAARF